MPGDRRNDLLDLPVDKMLLVTIIAVCFLYPCSYIYSLHFPPPQVLRSKLLILRDTSSFPLRAVPREVAILSFILDYIQHREAARRAHAADLLACVRLYLLPLAREAGARAPLEFQADRWLPHSIDQLSCRLSLPTLTARLEQLEKDVRYLHTTADPGHLYRDTYSEQVKALSPAF